MVVGPVEVSEKFLTFIVHEYALPEIRRCNDNKENKNIFIFLRF